MACLRLSRRYASPRANARCCWRTDVRKGLSFSRPDHAFRYAIPGLATRFIWSIFDARCALAKPHDGSRYGVVTRPRAREFGRRISMPGERDPAIHHRGGKRIGPGTRPEECGGQLL